MWAYLAGYEIPNDDPDRLRARVHVDYPWKIDRVLGLGHTPTVRLQQLFASPPDRFRRFEKALVWSHWVWFFVPHTSVLYVLLRRREHFPRTAVSMYAVFDLGLVAYWTIPTAPPWYAAAQGRMEHGDTHAVRRMMIEYGEQFWADRWGPLYSSLAGNPLAAMPSLHFATSVMAAHVLTDAGPLEGAVGWTYATLLGIALVYLGEHYLVDLLVGLTLTETVRRGGPRFGPGLRRVSRVVQMLETRASR
jgi:membrane-associated phospholipid phosphatase